MSEPTPPAEPPVLSPAEARELTNRIKAALEATWQLIAEAYLKRAWSALGYQSWDAYVLAEFGSCPLRVPREDRPEMVRSLRSQEMSLRAIAGALGVSDRTVRRDLDQATAANAAVDVAELLAEEPIATVVGLDGRRQPASRREVFWRRPSSPPPTPPKPIVVVRDPAPPRRPPMEPTWAFLLSASSLVRSAEAVGALHKRAKDNPNKRFDDGVAKIRKAIAVLQAILPADD